VRLVDLKKIEFDSFSDIKRLPLDKKAQDVEDITPLARSLADLA
jgi:predicted CopG family antitoxin